VIEIWDREAGRRRRRGSRRNANDQRAHKRWRVLDRVAFELADVEPRGADAVERRAVAVAAVGDAAQ
jgi:hypothetical protein